MPARGGSKTLPRKNVLPLCGKPLIRWTIDEALRSTLNALVVTTDDAEIASHCSDVHVLMRPPELARDDTPMLPVVQHALASWHGRKADAVVLLQPTSPLRLAADIDVTLEMLEWASCVVSVERGVHPVKLYDAAVLPFAKQVPYDKRAHACWARNGAIFGMLARLPESGRLLDDLPQTLPMPRSRSIDIDTEEDFFMAEALIKAGVLQRASAADRVRRDWERGA